MFKVFFFPLLMLPVLTQASPVVNENQANSGVVTIYADHQDPHHYYISPNVVTLAKDANGHALFSFSEYRQNLFEKKALVQMTLIPSYTQDELALAEKQILVANPQAQFSGLPFVDSHIDFVQSLQGLVESQDCSHKSGLIGQEISCSFTLTPQGRKVFLDLLKRQSLVTTMTYEYSVNAVIKNAQGGFDPFTLDLAVAARIDGAQLVNDKAVFAVPE